MKRLCVVVILLTIAIVGCTNPKVRKEQLAREAAEREANTKAFCTAWSKLKPGMTVRGINAAGIDTWLPCTPGKENINKLGHVTFKFNSQCRLEYAETKVACENRIIAPNKAN